MKKLLLRKMRDAKWKKEDIEEFKTIIEGPIDESVKISSANVDPKTVNVKFSNGTRLTYTGGK